MVKPICVLVVDSQSRTRSSLKALLATAPQVRNILEASDRREALRLAEESKPDVVLIDARMPEMDELGLEVSRIIKSRWPQIKVIVLSMYVQYATLALEAGADAFVSKGEPPEKLLTALSSVVEPHDQDLVGEKKTLKTS